MGNENDVRARWLLCLLGGFELTELASGKTVALPGKRDRLLLAYLALRPHHRQTRRALATLLWGDSAEETAQGNLRTCLWTLRKALGETKHLVLKSEGEDIVLEAAAFDVDAVMFRDLAAQLGREQLEQAARLYRGEFLDALDVECEEFESWRREEAALFRNQAVDVLSRLMLQLAESGQSNQAIEAGLRILRLDPLHEAAIRHLMRLYGETGRRGIVVQLYHMLEERLRTELDSEPEAETRSTFAEIARSGESPARAESSGDNRVPPNPENFATQHDAASELRRRPLRPALRFGASLAILASALTAVIVLVAWLQFAPFGVRPADLSAPRGAISIAVLPFANMSGDPAQDFFSDGMTEEITTALARIPNLRIVARQSALQFKGEQRDLRAVGRALGATHLIEGSVRKAGNRLRITAQLIKADDGTYIWAEAYDRELNDVFAIQEDIANAITRGLRVPLGLEPGEYLVANRMDDTEFYQDYLRGRAAYRARNVAQAITILEGVVEHGTQYAPAFAFLAQAYDLAPAYDDAFYKSSVEELRRLADADLPRAEAASRRAIQLDPRNADGYTGLALAQVFRGKLLDAEQSFRQALGLDPLNPDTLHQYSDFVAVTGRLREAIGMRQQLRTLEPLVPVYNNDTVMILLAEGENEKALALTRSLPSDAGFRVVALPKIYAAMGRYGEAADAALNSRRDIFVSGAIDAAARLLRTAPAQPSRETPYLGLLSFTFAYVGMPERALEFEEGSAKAGYRMLPDLKIWQSDYRAVRQTQRFKDLVRRWGLVDYWREKGWPEFCHPTPSEDFECN